MQADEVATTTTAPAASAAGAPRGARVAGAPGAIDASVFEWLDRLFGSVRTELAGSIGLVVALVVVALVVRWAGPRFKERFPDLTVETVQALVVTLGAGAVAVVLVGIWGGEAAVTRALDLLNVTPRDVVATVLTVAFLAAGFVATRLTKRVVGHVAAERAPFSEHHQEVAHHVVQIAVFLVVFLLVLSVWRVPVGSLLLGAGVLSVVLGLAARQTLGAVLAGFVVLFSRPFELGDWVVVGDDEGVVRDVTIVNTRLRTFDDEVLIVPNDVVTSSTVVNRSEVGRYRVSVDVGVDYDADVEAAAGLAEAAMADVETVLDRPEPHVVLTEFGDSAVVLRLRFYIDDPTARKMWRARTRVIEAVKERFEAAGVDIPFPQQVLAARGEEGFRLAPTPPADEPDADDGGSPGDSDDGSDGSAADRDGEEAGDEVAAADGAGGA